MNMKFKFLILFISFAITSCSQNIEKAKLANDYVEELQGKNLRDIKTKLQNDLIFLNKLVEATSFEFRLTTHFSSGQKVVVKKSVSEFNIEYNIPEVTHIFNDYCKQISFVQNFQENYSENKLILGNGDFTFSSNFDLSEKDSIFKQLRDNIQYKEKKVFSNGKILELNQIGLRKVDSIVTDIRLDVPLSFDKFSISKNQNKTTDYKGYIIKTDKINENIVELTIPIGLYRNIIGYQAFNKNNVRMNVSAFSSNSLLEVNQITKDNLKNLKNIFQKILNENDEHKAKSYLKEINQAMFDSKNEMFEFDNFVVELGKNKNRQEALGLFGIYEETAEKGKKVLWVQNEFANVEFPDDVQSIEIYARTNSIKLEREQIAYCDKDKFYDDLNPNIIFNTFERGKGHKYGISDKFGNKIIDALYDFDQNFNQRGNEYFFINDKLQWLDVANKKIVHLSEFYDYHGTIKKGYDIFDKKKYGNVGLVKDRKEIILPFEYFSITDYKKFILGNRSYDEAIDLFDMNFKKIQKNEIKKFYKVDEFIAADITFPSLFVAENADGKKALMDINLKYLTPFKYDFIKPFYTRSDYYNVGVQAQDGNGYLCTLIDEKGNEVAPPIFNEFYLVKDKVTFEINKKSHTMDLSQFIKTYANK